MKETLRGKLNNKYLEHPAIHLSILGAIFAALYFYADFAS
jgi:hypothetical protein